MFEKLKQFKDARSKAKALQERLKTVTVNAESGNIQAVMDGNQQLVGIDIHTDYLKPERKQDLEKQIVEVVNKAVRNSQVEMAKAVQNMPDLNIPKPF